MALQRALCARFHAAVELVGRRWTGAVIQLLLDGRMRYAELRGAIPDISDRMLSERLRELESEGIVARLVIPETPVRVEYELTEKGRALERALAEIGKWAERWGADESNRSGGASPPRDNASPRPRRAAQSRSARRGRRASG
jgi:DNA-binding HxlR family transcriptional regulator